MCTKTNQESIIDASNRGGFITMCRWNVCFSGNPQIVLGEIPHRSGNLGGHRVVSLADVGCMPGGFKSKLFSIDKFVGSLNKLNQRKYTWVDEGRYEGDLVNGLPTGKGIYTWVDGDRYEGDFVKGEQTGKGILIWVNGDRYEGDFVKGAQTGKGIYTWVDGDRYEGDFIKGVLTGKGIFTLINGDRYEGDFVNGLLQTNISDMRTTRFLKYVSGINLLEGIFSSYCLGIISDYLIKNHYLMEGVALQSAIRIMQSSDEELKLESNKIYEDLMKKSCLLYYGYKEHSMGLNLMPDVSSQSVIFEIFNSGEGLNEYHMLHPEIPRKFQTKLSIKIPKDEITQKVIEQLCTGYNEFQNADQAYQMIRNLPGAKTVEIDSKFIVWQTSQKGENCAIEWIFAYLKNTMSLAKYNRMRRELFEACIESLKINDEISMSQREAILFELRRKSAKRALLV